MKIKLICIMTTIVLTGCSKTPSSSTATEDSSASGAAASVVGGSLSSSSSGGNVALNRKSGNLEKTLNFIFPDALASNSCATFATIGTACSVSSSSMWVTDSSCGHSNSSATWTGVTLLKMNSGTAACGTFPKPAASGTLLRQYVTAANGTTPGSMVRVNAKGTSVTIDDATANLGNFDNQTIATLGNGGYGTLVSFNPSGGRSSIQIAKHQYVTNGYDHSTTGTLTVTETSGASSRSVSGTMTVYHNKMKVVGTSVFNSVTHSDTCCTPVSGSITTSFAAGTNVAPNTPGSVMVGKSEIMTFTGCGTANLQAADGTTSEVSLSNCF